MPGGAASRWSVGEADVVWMAPPSPSELHIVFGRDGELGPALVAEGAAVLWLPGPPERPPLNEALLRRAGRPPAHFALQHGWAAITAARLGRFGPAGAGLAIAHAGGDPVAAAWLTAFDPRIRSVVGLPPSARPGDEALLALARCKEGADSPAAAATAPLAPPRPATAPQRSAEPAPWEAPFPPATRHEASPPPPRAWLVYGPAPAGVLPPHLLAGSGELREGSAEVDLPPTPRDVAALGAPKEAIGFLGSGGDGVRAMRLALATGGVAVAVGAPVTLWTDEAEVGPWPAWVVAAGAGAEDDPWWLATALGDRLVLVDPRGALGEPWAGPSPPSRVVGSVAEAVALLGG
jgi:hypothetical protein